MEKIAEFLKEKKYIYEENVSFKVLTSYKTGGRAKYVVHPSDEKQLSSLLSYIDNNKIEYYVFGNGTNILASDAKFEGVIIKLDQLNKIIINDKIVTVESGYNLSKFALELTRKGYKNFDSFVSIPGTIGGAVYMNAGAYLSKIEDVIISVNVLSKNKIRTLTKSGMKFSYRKSIFQNKKEMIIISATFKLEKGNANELITLIEERTKKRLETQPLDKPSAGSVFKNPANDYAGRLIEECGLKGYKLGGALISLKHANFIVNEDDATSEDILSLMKYVKHEVKNKFDIDLTTEQILFNFK